MKIEYITGDLMSAEEHYLVHGCNAQGAMGSGVAKLIRDKYPEAYTEYRAEYDRKGLAVGETVWVNCGQHTIINAITQEFYGRDPNVVYVDYDGLATAMAMINYVAVVLNASLEPGHLTRVAMPLIGAGLANGSWAKIAEIIEEESKDFQPVVYLIDGVIPTS